MRWRQLRAVSAFEDLVHKAQELKQRGLSDREVADELNLQVDTVVWLLLREQERKTLPAPTDYAVNWSAIGSSPRRINLIGLALADLVRESQSAGDFREFDVVVGIEMSGIPLGIVVADDLEKPFAAARAAKTTAEAPANSVGTISANYASVEGKATLLVTDVISTGVILKEVVKSLRESKAKPMGMVTFIDKRGGGDIEGVPVKSLLKMIPLKK